MSGQCCSLIVLCVGGIATLTAMALVAIGRHRDDNQCRISFCSLLRRVKQGFLCVFLHKNILKCVILGTVFHNFMSKKYILRKEYLLREYFKYCFFAGKNVHTCISRILHTNRYLSLQNTPN
jgi:hypothetical protein